MKKNLLNNLNNIQQEAVKHISGPVLILAGAGSGKTRVLTYKAVYLLLDKHVSPQNILMVTFTNKAAEEMKRRICQLVNLFSLNKKVQTIFEQMDRKIPFAGTFHSFCAKILRINGSILHINPNYVIYDDQDKKEAIKDCLKMFGLDEKKYNPSSLSRIISNAKNELISPLEYLNIARGSFQETAAKIFLKYQRLLKDNNALDFDDLIGKTVELLLTDREIASYYQNLYQYILVDEYQDTNHAQYMLTKLLAKKWKNLCVVGDASQSIYNFRGADYRNILNFKKDYPEVKVFNLEQNYRSSQNILDAAYSIISKNKSHPILKLWTENKTGENILVYEAENELNEAKFILNEIVKNISDDSSIRFRDFALLYRTNAQSRIIEEVFLHASIPYILVGGVRFYERKEIKDVLSYLRLVYNPQDKISYKRIEKLGKKRFLKYLQYVSENKKDLEKGKVTTLQILDSLLKQTGYLEKYDPHSPEDSVRLENIMELRSVATLHPKLNDFLENVSLVEQEYLPSGKGRNSSEKDAVSLMTIHAAKGLEFNCVFLLGMEEGLFPHARSLLDPTSLEEERRLCYVGITRAMKKLYLSYAKRRLYFGQINTNQTSRFVFDIPPELTVAVNSY
ncbi:hypothetical protein A2Y99_03485 [Candidatus Gottesmanbacteria bacterium RBG_13_37_7]|uniref:DNA 3'-5' helicase n=1 Tax=Candidatus Gottesmanbacteria bacterium RBG_13_37_7 TaxID=1798369 RepID=A0A1F5YJ54_9BACT|nr:MAG: hypothetical protein A2Y99_03485 [Candidatus Gottesmanbacteria bacterium RBG_13_37_7]